MLKPLATICLALGLAAPARAAEYTFKLHHFLSPESLSHTEMIEPWVRAVERNAEGAVEIEIYPAMTLGGRPPELIGQARDGVVDIVWTVNGYTPGLFPRTEVFELPTVFTDDPRAANLAMLALFETDLREEYDGVEVMFLHTHGGNGLQMRNRAVRSPADLAGQKMRIPTRTGAWMIQALDAVPVAMPVPDLPAALQKGVIDGAFIPWEIIPPLQIQDQTEYQIEGAGGMRFGTITFQMSMNKALWNSLPPGVQEAFRLASGPEWLAEVGEIYRAADAFGINLAVEAGNSHIVLSAPETEAFRDALAPVVTRWVEDVTARGIDGAALVEKARHAIAKFDTE